MESEETLFKAIHLIIKLFHVLPQHAIHQDIHKPQLLLLQSAHINILEHLINNRLYSTQYLNTSIFQMHHVHSHIAISLKWEQVRLKAL